METLFNINKLAWSKFHGIHFPIARNMMVDGSGISSLIAGDAAKLKALLKEAIVRLEVTRNKADYVFDNENALKIASRIIPSGDAEDLLLAMTIKSDYSLVFKNRRSAHIAEVRIENLSEELIEEKLNNPIDLVKSIPLSDQDEVIWLGLSEYKLYQLNLFRGNYVKSQIEGWSFEALEKWHTESEDLLYFDTTIKDERGEHANVRLLVSEDFEQLAQRAKQNLDFVKVNTDPESENILLIKDTRISSFPHNLLLDQHGNYLSLQKPVANILSVEWLAENIAKATLNKAYSRGFWIPIEAGDMTINQLFAKLEDCLNENNFNIIQAALPEQPLKHDLAILSSHGDKDIALYQSLYLNETDLVHSTQDIVDTGEVIILFVCHSGSMVQDLYRNQFDSLIRYYFSLGYKAVIAPFWSLHIDVPPIWLPVFMAHFNSGASISDAVFQANQAVHDVYAAPGAWACLHLYGDSQLRVSD